MRSWPNLSCSAARCSRTFSWVDQVASEALQRSVGRHGGQNRAGVPFQGARGDGGGFSDAEDGGFLCFLLEVAFGQGLELGRILLLNGGAVAVELLNVVDPCYALGDPGIDGLESVLELGAKDGERVGGRHVWGDGSRASLERVGGRWRRRCELHARAGTATVRCGSAREAGLSAAV